MIAVDMDALAVKVLSFLDQLCEEMAIDLSEFKVTVNGYRSDNCFLFVYFSIVCLRTCEEVAVCIDIIDKDDELRIVSDISKTDGVIVAAGPSMSIDGDLSKENIQGKIDDWFEVFMDFICKNKNKLSIEIAEMLKAD